MGIIGGIIILVAILTTFISVVALAGPTIGAGIVAIAAGIASAAAIIAAAAPAIQAALIGVFTAFENAAPSFGNAVTALIRSLIPAVNELIILAGVASRQFISQIYQIIKQ